MDRMCARMHMRFNASNSRGLLFAIASVAFFFMDRSPLYVLHKFLMKIDNSWQQFWQGQEVVIFAFGNSFSKYWNPVPWNSHHECAIRIRVHNESLFYPIGFDVSSREAPLINMTVLTSAQVTLTLYLTWLELFSVWGCVNHLDCPFRISHYSRFASLELWSGRFLPLPMKFGAICCLGVRPSQ